MARAARSGLTGWLQSPGGQHQWTDAIDKALSGASHVTKEQVDGDSADEVKAAAAKNPPATTA